MSPDKLDTTSKEQKHLKAQLEVDTAKDRFFLLFTPEWFRWLGWIIVLGALMWLQRMSGSAVVAAIYGISFANLLAYFEAFFFQRFRELQEQTLGTARSRSHKLSFGLATIATLVSYLLSFYLSLLFGQYK